MAMTARKNVWWSRAFTISPITAQSAHSSLRRRAMRDNLQLTRSAPILDSAGGAENVGLSKNDLTQFRELFTHTQSEAQHLDKVIWVCSVGSPVKF